MRVDWKLFADLADVADGREVTVEVDDAEPTVGDALEALVAARPALEERTFEDGALAPHINVLRNGANLDGEGLDTPVRPDDELALFPPVSGG